MPLIFLKAQPLLTGGCPETRERHGSRGGEKGAGRKMGTQPEVGAGRGGLRQGPRVATSVEELLGVTRESKQALEAASTVHRHC